MIHDYTAPDNIDLTEEELRAKHGQLWTTKELTRDFTVNSFAAPYVGVTRNSDGQRGWLEFTHRPRFYFSFEPDNWADQ